MKNLFKDYKTYIIIALILFIVLLTFLFYNTYAKYITSVSGDASANVARWRITLNNYDVSNGNEFSSVITPVFAGNSNVASGVIAPGAEGYFDIVLDASDTDVSLRYIITASENEDSAVGDIVVSGYSIDGGARQSVVSAISGTTSEVTSSTSVVTSGVSQLLEAFRIEDTILYNSQDKEVEIRIYVKWTDDENDGATMNNSADTAATYNANNKAKINVNLRLIQIAN